MSYRGPQPQRQALQFDEILARAGQTARWQQWISASASSANNLQGGLGSSAIYLPHTITALITPHLANRPDPGLGPVISGSLIVTSREPMNPGDLLIWQGRVLHVASRLPHALLGAFQHVVKAGGSAQ